MNRSAFGTLPDGQAVEAFTLTNANGMEVKAITLGGIITSLKVPDKSRQLGDVVLGYDTLQGYLDKSPFFGTIVGRYGNRIGKGRFTLDGTSYQLSVNDGENSLHGGSEGFDKAVWDVEPFTRGSDVGLVLQHTSADGEMGFPGTLRTKVTYTLTEHGDWRVDYEATTDKVTVVNLTSHVYWNLAGESGGSIDGHELEIAAARYTPVDSGLIPAGEPAEVAGTPFDFRTPKTVGADLRVADQQLLYAKGFDHNWVLDKGVTAEPEHVATLREPESGRTLRIATTEPGLQFYSGNFLDGTLVGTGGAIHRQGDALCLETQHHPDSPNRPDFPSTVLRPGQTYRTTTIHSFDA